MPGVAEEPGRDGGARRAGWGITTSCCCSKSSRSPRATTRCGESGSTGCGPGPQPAAAAARVRLSRAAAGAAGVHPRASDGARGVLHHGLGPEPPHVPVWRLLLWVLLVSVVAWPKRRIYIACAGPMPRAAELKGLCSSIKKMCIRKDCHTGRHL